MSERCSNQRTRALNPQSAPLSFNRPPTRFQKLSMAAGAETHDSCNSFTIRQAFSPS